MLKKLLAALMLLALVLAVSVSLPLPDRTTEPRREAPPPAAVSIRYREAESIILASCMRVSRIEGEPLRTRFMTEEVLAGTGTVGEAFTIAYDAVPGQRYLLFLRMGTDPETGEPTGLESLPGSPVTVEDGVVICDGQKCTYESVLSDIERQNAILTVPAREYYYDDLDSLVSACDRIVVGRVLEVSEPTKTLCRSVQKGETTLNTLEQIFMRVKIENPLYSGLAAGDVLDVVLEPWYVRPVTNAHDLSAKTVAAPPESAPAEGSVCIFFLLKSEDPKSGKYFTVNPYEGYVTLVGNSIIHPYYNEAFAQINDLRVFAQLLREREGH